MDQVEITINLNIIVGDFTGSAVIQGGDGNEVNISAGSIPPDVLGILRLLSRQYPS